MGRSSHLVWQSESVEALGHIHRYTKTYQWTSTYPQAIELYPNTAETYEYKCRSLIHQARAEATDHSATDQGPNGIATGKLAYETAWRAVQKFGTSRWEVCLSYGWCMSDVANYVRACGSWPKPHASPGTMALCPTSSPKSPSTPDILLLLPA